MHRYALITGASGGLARAVATRLKADGWSLVLASRSAEISEVAKEFDALPVAADVSTEAGSTAVMEACLAEFGAAPQGLAQCAGDTLILPLHRTTAQQYRDCLAANLDSAFFTLRAYIRACLDRSQPGAAVLISSVVARIGVANHETIAAAKGAVEALVRSAAATYAAKGIRVNGIAPGLMRSPLTERLFVANAEKHIAAQYPLARYGSVDDGAEAVRWLLSDASSWVTGQVLPIDGGFSAVRPLVRV